MEQRSNPARAGAGRSTELVTLALVVLSVLGLWALAELADEVLEGATRNLDRDILLLLREPDNLDQTAGPWWLQEMGRDLTGLGGIAALTLAAAGTAGFFVIRRQWGSACFLLLVIGGGMAFSTLAKIIIDRPRPDLVAHGSLVETASFPSGHSMMAAVVYLTLGTLIARVLPRRRQKVYVLAVAIVLTLLVGVSRVYLGVHWPTDVLAGWLAGALWAVVCFLVARVLARRGHVEDEC